MTPTVKAVWHGSEWFSGGWGWHGHWQRRAGGYILVYQMSFIGAFWKKKLLEQSEKLLNLATKLLSWQHSLAYIWVDLWYKIINNNNE